MGGSTVLPFTPMNLSLPRARLRSFLALSSVVASFALSTESVIAQPPPGYYDTVDPTSASTLRATLHAVIDDHTRFPYTAGSTDTWNILNLADEDPSNSGRILDVNRNRSFQKFTGGNSFYNRDHIWPSSYGFPDDNPSNYPYTDCHMLHLSDDGYNTSRSNKLYRYCSAACSEEVTDVNNGTGGGSGSYPGNSNWTSGQFTTGTWEQWMGKRGDVARTIFYMDVRYEGGLHGITGASEPDLIVTDNVSLIDASNTGSNESVAYYGLLSDLLQWHREDPVDADEIRRNNVVFGFQGNRNPFVDNPQWVDCLFGVGSAPSQQVIRFGTPSNPFALFPGVAPVVGATWNPLVLHGTFLPDAVVDVMLITAQGTAVNIPSNLGTILCDLGTPTLSVVAPGPGQNFSIPLLSCQLTGLGFCAQGVSANASGVVRFTNALDVVIGG